jgi:flagellin
MIINTNAAATSAIYNLNINNNNLRKSITRLSSGLRVNSALDDPSGLAVSLKLSAAMRQTEALERNVESAQSLLQVQAKNLEAAGKVLINMQALAASSENPLQTNDRIAYNAEFIEFGEQFTGLLEEEFNGISLFSTTGATLTLKTSVNGSQTIDITQSNLNDIEDTIVDLDISTQSGASAASTVLDTAIENLGVLLAKNGAEQSRVTFAVDILQVNRINLEAASSQIMDTDMAQESTNYARSSMLADAGIAMLAQANMIPDRALRLLEFN